jgi:phosphoribosylglycinamide formyltransferase-1
MSVAADRLPIVVLISGNGSNLRAIARQAESGALPVEIRAVVSDRADAAGLAWAADHGLHTVVVPARAFQDRADFDAALAAEVERHAPGLVVLAGFMRVLGAGFVDRYAGRLLNIHPSLLPAFPGLHTHRRAIAAGCKCAGATVHFVTTELDHGPIVAQSVVPVLDGDDEDALAERVLATEHVIFPLAVRWFVEGRLALDADGRVRQLDGESQLLVG